MADLPPDWSEIGKDDEALETAFDLLEATFPYRYLHYDVPTLRDKMYHVRGVPSLANATNNVDVSSLRVFMYTPGGHSGIAAFFFLRYNFQANRAYCLSVGLDHTVVTTAGDLHLQLVAICKHMQQLDGVRTLNVVNQRVIPTEDDLGDTDASRLVRGAFDIASTTAPKKQLVQLGDIQPGPPWPSRLKRWQVAAL